MPVHSNSPSDTLVRAAIDLRRFSWIRPLVAAYSSDFPSVASLFAGNPADPDAWTQAIARVQRRPRDRAGVSQVVAAQLERRNAPALARSAASQLADPSAVAIVTGRL